jgi:predicted MPP superfamily phosphohydrolase
MQELVATEHDHRPRWPPLRRFARRCGRLSARVSAAFFPSALGRWLHYRLRTSWEVRVVRPELAEGASWPSIAFLSDVHAGHYMTEGDLADLARLIAALQPDLVCLGGDLVHTRLEELAHFERALRTLASPLGLFAVPGNHDYVEPARIERWSAMLETRGVRVLRNRGQRLWHSGKSLWLCGVDDLTEGRPDLDAALRGREPGERTLLLSHHPDLFALASQRDVDLQLSGHTHGGQIRLFGWAPFRRSRLGYVQGLYERDGARLFVSRGAGVSFVPLRVGTRSEAVLLRPR